MKAVVIVISLFCSITSGSDYLEELRADLQDFVEMVPFKEMMEVGMQYASSDAQTMQLLEYFQGDRFMGHLTRLKESNVALAEAAGYGPAFNEAVEKMEMMVKMTQALAHARSKRAVGEGVFALIKEEVALLPLNDMKQMFNHKMNTRPLFKEMVERFEAEESKEYMRYLEGLEPIQAMRKDLLDMGVPLHDIAVYLRNTFKDFSPDIRQAKKR